MAAKMRTKEKKQEVILPSDEEIVAYVPRHALVSRRWLGHGFRGDDNRSVYEGLLAAMRYGPRGPLERNPERKQIVSYVVLTDGAGAVYTLRRTSRQTEVRLHDKLSFGVGGHIERVDGDSRAYDLIHQGMLRELREELVLAQPYRICYRGVLNDDTNDVGQVHLGCVFTCHVGDRQQVAVRETTKMEGHWLALDEVHQHADQLETWSSLLLPYLRHWIGSMERP